MSRFCFVECMYCRLMCKSAIFSISTSGIIDQFKKWLSVSFGNTINDTDVSGQRDFLGDFKKYYDTCTVRGQRKEVIHSIHCMNINSKAYIELIVFQLCAFIVHHIVEFNLFFYYKTSHNL